jgi:hypothetical protein
MAMKIVYDLINYPRIKRLTGILLISLIELSLMGQETSVSNINSGVPIGLRRTETQIAIKKFNVRIYRIKPETTNNFEEYEIYPLQFINPESGIFDSLLLANMQIKISNSPVRKNKKTEILQNLKVSGLIAPSSDGSLVYFGEHMITPYGFTFLLHDGSVTLSSLKAITKDWNGQIGGILEFSVNNNDTIIFSKLIQGPALGGKDKVELTIAGPGAKISIADGSIIDVEGLHNKLILPDDKTYKHIDQKTIKVTLNESMLVISYKTMHSSFRLDYKWLVRTINGKSIGKLELIQSEDIAN